MKYLLTSIISILSISAFASDDILVVHLAGGSQQMYDIREPISIKESNDSLHITSSHISAAYSTANVKDYSFIISNDISNGITSPTLSQGQGITITREKNIFTFRGTKETTRLKVYSINGKEQSPKTSYLPNSITLDISSLPLGVYILQFSGCDNAPSMKITKF